MDELPPELAGFSVFLEAQPKSTREAFHYCLCPMMVEAGKVSLVEVIPRETVPLYFFESIAGEMFAIPRPSITPEEESELIDALHDILKDEDLF